MHTTKRKSSSQKASDGVIPTMRRSGKGKTVETVQRSAVARAWGGRRGEQAEPRGVLEQRKHSV